MRLNQQRVSRLRRIIVCFKQAIDVSQLKVATKNGKPLAARLATRLEAGCVPDCARLNVNEKGGLIGERITYSGNAVAKATFNSKPQIATIPARAFEKLEPEDRSGEGIKVDVKIEEPKTEVVETKPLETKRKY